MLLLAAAAAASGSGRRAPHHQAPAWGGTHDDPAPPPACDNCGPINGYPTGCQTACGTLEASHHSQALELHAGGGCLNCSGVVCTADVAPDTSPPAVLPPGAAPAPMARTIQVALGWEHTRAYHTLLLPARHGAVPGPWPVLVELPGNYCGPGGGAVMANSTGDDCDGSWSAQGWGAGAYTGRYALPRAFPTVAHSCCAPGRSCGQCRCPALPPEHDLRDAPVPCAAHARDFCNQHLAAGLRPVQPVRRTAHANRVLSPTPPAYPTQALFHAERHPHTDDVWCCLARQVHLADAALPDGGPRC